MYSFIKDSVSSASPCSNFDIQHHQEMGSEASFSRSLNLGTQLWCPEGTSTSVGCLGPSRKMKAPWERAGVAEDRQGNQRKIQRGQVVETPRNSWGGVDTL